MAHRRRGAEQAVPDGLVVVQVARGDRHLLGGLADRARGQGEVGRAGGELIHAHRGLVAGALGEDFLGVVPIHPRLDFQAEATHRGGRRDIVLRGVAGGNDAEVRANGFRVESSLLGKGSSL